MRSAATKMPLLGSGIYKAKEGSEVIRSVHNALEALSRHVETLDFTEKGKELKKVENFGSTKRRGSRRTLQLGITSRE